MPHPTHRPRAALLAAASLLALATATTSAQDDRRPREAVLIEPENIPTLQITLGGGGASGGWIGNGGGCQPTVSYTNANFDGGPVVVQAGFAEQEIAAASYTLAPAEFPIRMDSVEFVVATAGTTVQTVTEWTFLLWDGPPETGDLVTSFSSDGDVLPHIVLPPGNSGINLLLTFSPDDPIFVNGTSGTDQFSIGLRIDQHNNQTSNPCFVAPPASSNAFPTTDTSGLASSAGNWLFGLNCGPFGCPPNGGWTTFAGLNFLCRPSGDWIIRATYTPQSCGGPTGACCFGGDTCVDISFADCTAASGSFLGAGTECVSVVCPFGACCFPDGTCGDDVAQTECEQQFGGIYAGDGSFCADTACEGNVPCCFPGGCLDLSESACISAGGVPGPVGSFCATFDCDPTGACCLPDGTCMDAVASEDCAAMGGVYQGDDATCASSACVGACCLANGFCLDVDVEDCGIAGGEWQGPATSCAGGCDAGCDADVTGDGSIDLADLNLVLGNFNDMTSEGDVDGSGTVDLADLNAILEVFGTDC